MKFTSPRMSCVLQRSAAGRPSGTRPAFRRKVLLHLWCDFRAAFPQQRAGVKTARGHTWKENLVFRLKGGAVNRATCPAELSQGVNSEKVSSDRVKKNPFKILSTRAVTEVIGSIYNVTTYLTLSQWPWNYYGHPNIIVVLNWEWSVRRNFAWGFQNVTRPGKKIKNMWKRTSSGARQRSAERRAVVVVSLFLC